jgi:hypothetical protein
MNYYIEQHDIELILDALENYRLDIEHGNDNGHENFWTIEEVDQLYDDLVNQSDVT